MLLVPRAFDTEDRQYIVQHRVPISLDNVSVSDFVHYSDAYYSGTNTRTAILNGLQYALAYIYIAYIIMNVLITAV